MAGNLRIGGVNLLDASGATVTCSNQDPSYPASNVRNSEIGTPFRTLSLTATVVCTLAAEVTLSTFAVALIKHNLTSAGVYTLTFKDRHGVSVVTISSRAANADGFWSKKVDGQSRNIAVYQGGLGGSVTFQSVEITPSDAGNPDGYFEIPRIFIGSLLEPAIGMDYGWSSQWVDASLVNTTVGGNPVSRLVMKARKLSLDLKWLTEAEGWNGYFEQIDAIAGKTRDVLVLPFPETPTNLHLRAVWGRHEDTAALANPVFQRYATTRSFIERT